MMIDKNIINLAILLSFTYFTSSLILSSIIEGISQSVLRLRQRNLKHAIEVLFVSREWRDFVRKKFVTSPHIKSLMKKQGRYPSYIPANNFFLFVLEQIDSKNYTEDKLQEAITLADIPKDFRKVLLDLAAQGGNKPEQFEKNLTRFYDDALDHSTDWYRRKVRRLLLIMAIILAVLLNLDTIKISNDALEKTGNLEHMAATISQQVEAGTMMPGSQSGDKESAADDAKSDSLRLNNAGNNLSRQNDAIRAVQNYEQSTGLHLGYRNHEFYQQWFSDWPWNFLEKLLGILITAFAVQLGSNYWFDIMKKAISYRSPAKKRESK